MIPRMRPPPLPATYLRYFSIDPTHCARDSWVWRITEAGPERVQVSAECPSQGRFSGSKTEELYARFVDKIRAGLELSALESHGLVAAMFAFHARRLAQELAPPGEAGHPDRNRRQPLLASTLLDQPAGSVRTAEIVHHLQQHWDLRVFAAAHGHRFITSDSPAVRFCLNPQQPALHLVLLPLTPDHLAVAYDKRFLETASAPLEAKDHQALNAAQVRASAASLYSNYPLRQEELAVLQHHCPKRCHAPCQGNAKDWLVPLQCLPPERHYSFVALVSPSGPQVARPAVHGPQPHRANPEVVGKETTERVVTVNGSALMGEPCSTCSSQCG
jgi:hypothetical protein